jgi:hypothetical protein
MAGLVVVLNRQHRSQGRRVCRAAGRRDRAARGLGSRRDRGALGSLTAPRPRAQPRPGVHVDGAASRRRRPCRGALRAHAAPRRRLRPRSRSAGRPPIALTTARHVAAPHPVSRLDMRLPPARRRRDARANVRTLMLPGRLVLSRCVARRPSRRCWTSTPISGGFSPDRFEQARAELGVRVTLVRRGTWDADRLSAAQPDHLGLLILHGVIARRSCCLTRPVSSCWVAGTCCVPGSAMTGRRCRTRDSLDRAGVGAVGAARSRFRRPPAALRGGERGDPRARRRSRPPACADAGDLAAQRRRPSAADALLAPRGAMGSHDAHGIAVGLALSHRQLGAAGC